MKIAIFIPSIRRCGPCIVAFDQIKLCMAHGHECVVYYFNEGDYERIDFPCPTRRISLSSRIDLSAYDVVHCHGGLPNIFVFIHKPFWTKNKFIATIHGYLTIELVYRYGRIKGTALALLFLLSVWRFDKVIALSRHACKYYKRFFMFKKIEWCYNSINSNAKSLSVDECDEISKFKGSGVLLGMNAGMHKNKGQHIAIKLLTGAPQYKLFLLGTGPKENEFKQLAFECNVSDRVRFAGFKKNAVDYLAYYDVFLLLSRTEGCPLGLLEAAVANKKIVCSDIPVLREMFDDTEVVFCNIDDHQSLVTAIECAINNPVEQPKLQKRVHDLFAPEAVYAKLLKIYNS